MLNLMFIDKCSLATTINSLKKRRKHIYSFRHAELKESENILVFPRMFEYVAMEATCIASKQSL